MHSNRARISLIILLSAIHIQTIPVLHGNECLDDKISLCPQAFYLLPNKLHEFVKKKTPVNPPSMLHNSNLYGVVTVEVCVDKKGKVLVVNAIKGNAIAIQSVIESVRNWRFTPYRDNGKTIPVFGLIDINYDFRPEQRVDEIN